MLKFQEVVRPEIATYATPFRVFEDEKRTVLYYLVHLTDNDLGMREMKKAMVKKSADMTFWPVTVRPPDQLELEVAEAKPYPTLQTRLQEKFAGRTLTFLELLNEDYPMGSGSSRPTEPRSGRWRRRPRRGYRSRATVSPTSKPGDSWRAGTGQARLSNPVAPRG